MIAHLNADIQLRTCTHHDGTGFARCAVGCTTRWARLRPSDSGAEGQAVAQTTEESLEALRGELRSTRSAMDANAVALQGQVAQLRAAISDEVGRAAQQVCQPACRVCIPELQDHPKHCNA